MELARGHLLYGEWLRRERRRVDAREQLADGPRHVRLDGSRGVRRAGQARAVGHRRDRPQTLGRDPRRADRPGGADRGLARDGLSNPEIGTRLFISPRTVKYHLRKVFLKLDISSRNELDRVLPADATTAAAGSSRLALSTGGCERGPRE